MVALFCLDRRIRRKLALLSRWGQLQCRFNESKHGEISAPVVYFLAPYRIARRPAGPGNLLLPSTLAGERLCHRRQAEWGFHERSRRTRDKWGHKRRD